MAEVKPATGGLKGRPLYTRVTLAGLLLIALTFLFFTVLLTVLGGLEPILVVFLIVTLVVFGLVWRFGKWALIVAAIFALANLLLNGPFIVPSLSHFNSFVDFVPSLVVIVGSLLTLVGGIVAFVQQRRGAARTVATPGERITFRGIAIALVVLTVLSGVLTLTGRTSVSTEAKAGATQVTMKSTAFTPEKLDAKTGESLKLVVRNNDPFVHTFTIKDLNIKYTLTPGSEKLVELRVVNPGKFQFNCEVPGHEAMIGLL